MEIKNNINNLDPYNRTSLTNAAGQIGARGTAQAQPSAGETGDRVSLSPEAKLRTEALTTAMNAPEVRQAKVDAIKASVDSGEYAVDGKALAAKLIQEEPGLFQP